LTSRLRAPGTDADEKIKDVLNVEPLIGFTVIAGAGSGKTTSLVKALSHLTLTRGESLRANKQQVACITYTEVAAHEIHEEIGLDPLALVSTIHSFLWKIIEPFQRDIGVWVNRHLLRRIEELHAKQATYTKRTQEATKAKDRAQLEKREAQRSAAVTQQRWIYGVGNDFARGIVGHAAVIEMVPELMMEKPLLTHIVARRFPFIFVDESQDAFPDVVRCLKHVWSVADGGMCLGFFGDPMQQIYMQGIGDIEPFDVWARIQKPENFRSSKRVLACINAVRSAGDSLEQVSGLTEQPEGEAFCFVVSAALNRDEILRRVTWWLDVHSSADGWGGPFKDGGAKVLMIEHRMASVQLGFSSLHEAFRYGDQGLVEAFEEGTAWPLRPFRDVIRPLCSTPHLRSPAIVRLVTNGPLLRDREPKEVQEALGAARSAVVELKDMVADAASVSLGDVLRFAVDRGLVDPDPRLAAFLEPDRNHIEGPHDDRTYAVLTAMLACSYAELAGYEAYVERNSPYATHQGTKGAEFDRVVVVLDDADSRHKQFSYDKLLGLKALSDKDQEHQAAGEDSIVERTRRLLYVCVSRARISLAIVLVSTDVAAAVEVIRTSTLGERLTLLTDADLDGDA
jgi:DNA helicase II / ATP-dependent DNA helicase PcrA